MQDLAQSHRFISELLDEAILGCEAHLELRTHAMFTRFAGELRKHIHAEEETLIPLFEAHTTLQDIGLGILILREHREIEHQLDCIAEMLALHEDYALVEPLLLSLRELLVAHDHKEEGLFYPACDRFLTEVALRASLRALTRKGANDVTAVEAHGDINLQIAK